MTYFDATILGIIEGLSEFLPISSTAHLILTSKILGIVQDDFLKSFEIIIQLGAVLAVFTLYFKHFFKLEVLSKVFVGFLPTAIVGLLVYKRVKEYLGNTNVVLWALSIGGVILIVFEFYNRKRRDGVALASKSSVRDITLKDSLVIGLFQCIAFIPGVSRSAATIVGGMSIGVTRSTVAEYSFLLALPTIGAASGLDIIKNRDIVLHSGNFMLLCIGFVVSYIVALVAIRGFLSYVKTRDFMVFGVYRIVVSILFLLFVL